MENNEKTVLIAQCLIDFMHLGGISPEMYKKLKKIAEIKQQNDC
jgi:hypothetical protein